LRVPGVAWRFKNFMEVFNMEKLIKEWDACDKIKVFEFEVVDKRSGQRDWLTFSIEITEGRFRAQHGPLNTEQANSPYIAETWTVIDPDFSLDETLQEHYADCQQAIIDSEFYSLAPEEPNNRVILTLPAHYASYLINCDASGLTDDEQIAIDKFILDSDVGLCVGCSDESWFASSSDMGNMGADVCEFYFERS
jgi:hypothetical protein